MINRAVQNHKHPEINSFESIQKISNVYDMGLEAISQYSGCVSSLSLQGLVGRNTSHDIDYGIALGDNSHDDCLFKPSVINIQQTKNSTADANHYSISSEQLTIFCGYPLFQQTGSDEQLEELLLFNMAL